ncbi:MAG TPA: YdeI/OmpD-associated family protein [Pyrinomonadaceae bacterium]|nr:YdeI/OmpD-associated family protein [Pyrinomonadaceae bacterium]
MTTKKSTTKTAKATADLSKGTPKSPVKRFRVPLEQHESSTATGITIPFDVEKTFGTRARVPVRGTINGFPFRSSIFPMGGCHFMAVNREMRAGANVKGGDHVNIVMERDDKPRLITPPLDLARALRLNKTAQAAWDKLSYTHQKEHVKAIEDAKRLETRQRRIESSVALLAAGKKEPR